MFSLRHFNRATIAALFAVSSTALFAESQNTVELTVPSLTTPGNGGAFSVNAVTGPSAAGSGTVTKSYAGVLRYDLNAGTGRYNGLNVTRFGFDFDAFQILQSFLTAGYLTVVSTATTCPSNENYIWMLLRSRSPLAPRGPMDVRAPNAYVAGSLAYNSSNGVPFSIAHAISLGNLTWANVSETMDDFAACSSGVQKATTGGAILDAMGTYFFSNDRFLYISNTGNPLVAVGVQQTTLSAPSFAALSSSVLSGTYTTYPTASTQVRKNVMMFPDAAGTTYDVREATDLSNPFTSSALGTLDCSNLNSPTNGFCSGTLTISGETGTGNALCLFTDSPTASLFCTAQFPSNKAVAVSLVGRVLERSVLSIELPTALTSTGPSTSTTMSATVRNLSGRPVTTMGPPANPLLQLSAPLSESGLYAGNSSSGGACGTSLDGYGHCTLDVGFSPSAVGVYSQTFRVAYDNGATTVNATAAPLAASGLSSITISPTTLTPGQTQQLTATAHFSNATTQDITSVVTQWTSSNPAIATVSSTGLATVDSGASGSVDFGAYLNDQSGTTTASVAPPVWGGSLQIGATDSNHNSRTYGEAVASDSSGNVYTVAVSDGKVGTTSPPRDGNDDFTVGGHTLLIKYNSAGTLVWTREIGSSSHFPTYGRNIGIDGSDNIYVSGDTFEDFGSNSANEARGFLAKYNSSGVQQWCINAFTSGNGLFVYGMAVDSSGNSHLTGRNASGSPTVAFVKKFNSSGTVVWSTSVSGTGDTQGEGIALDGSGNIVIGGTTYGNLSGFTLVGYNDIFAAQINSSGVEQWHTQVGTAATFPTVTAVTADSSNNVYIAGNSFADFDGETLNGWADGVLTKFNSTGTKQWTRMVGVSSTATDIRGLTSDGTNIYVTGVVGASMDGNPNYTYNDPYIAVYNASGTRTSSMQYGSADGYTAYSNAISRDSGGGFQLAGFSTNGYDGTTSSEYMVGFVTKANSSLVKQWSVIAAPPNPYVTLSGLAVGAGGSVVVSGTQSGGAMGVVGASNYLSKYDGTGTKLWTVSTTDVPYGAATDGNGDVYAITGNNGTNTLRKYASSNGATGWTADITAAAFSEVWGVKTDASNNVYACGYTFGNLHSQSVGTSKSATLVKYNSSGTRQWTRLLGDYTLCKDIAVDASGNVFIVGENRYYTLGGVSFIGWVADLYVAKYNSSGTLQWASPYHSDAYTIGHSIVLDGSGNIYVAGTTGTGDGAYDTTTGLLLQMDATGTVQWAEIIGGGSILKTTSVGVRLDVSGNLYVSGTIRDSAGGSRSYESQSITVGYSTYLAQYDTSGALNWLRVLSGANEARVGSDGLRLDLNSAGFPFLGGTTSGGLDGNSLVGNLDAFIVQYDDTGTLQ